MRTNLDIYVYFMAEKMKHCYAFPNRESQKRGYRATKKQLPLI